MKSISLLIVGAGRRGGTYATHFCTIAGQARGVAMTDFVTDKTGRVV